MRFSVRSYQIFLLQILIIFTSWIECSNITITAFGGIRDALPSAYGDFNSDELTDIFILTAEQKTIQILYGSSDSDQLVRSFVF